MDTRCKLLIVSVVVQVLCESVDVWNDFVHERTAAGGDLVGGK